jgi:hypothetical protein
MKKYKMYIEMQLSGIVIDRLAISFDDYETTEDREIYVVRMIDRLYKKHVTKIVHSRAQPDFFIDHVPSKMNHYRHEKV